LCRVACVEAWTMASAPFQNDEYRVVVVNTFIDVVEVSASAAERQSALRPVKSDPLLCRLGMSADALLREMDELSERSWSQADNDTSSPAPASCGPLKHPVSEDSLSTAEADSAEVSSLGEEPEEDDAASEDTSAALGADVHSMAKENEMLTQQNVALLETVQRMQQSLQESSHIQGANMPQPGFVCAPFHGAVYAPMWLPAHACNREITESYSQSSAVQTGGAGHVSEMNEDSRTTVMLRNLPNNYTRAMFVELLETLGFGGVYNFLYLPIDFKTQAALGYAFVDLAHPSAVQCFWNVFHGFSNWSVPSRKKCFVTWCEPSQGLQTLAERYRNSPVMHEAVPDEYKPMLLEHGKRVPFPPPTKTIRQPRARDCRRKDC